MNTFVDTLDNTDVIEMQDELTAEEKAYDSLISAPPQKGRVVGTEGRYGISSRHVGVPAGRGADAPRFFLSNN